MSYEEACKVMNTADAATTEELKSRFSFLFSTNDRAKGGSFYLQSKIVRAYEAILRHRGIGK